jgi:hypothetical protein
MNWYPAKRVGLVWGMGLILVLLAVQLSLVGEMLGAPVDIWLFLRGLLLAATLPLLAFLAYWYSGLANLAYRVERNGIMIRWAAGCDMVPMGEIRRIEPFAKLGRKLTSGVGWPGYRVGQAEVEGVGPLRFYITRPPETGLLIRTRTMAYLITPANAEGFLGDYRARRKLGPIAEWTQELRLPALFGLGIWRDRLAGGLFAPGLLLNLGLFGYLAARYAGLPLRLALSYGLQGQADYIGSRTEIFFLPAVGLAVVLLNGALAAWLHRRERLLALVLLGNGPLVQALVWLAALRLTR